MICIAWFVSATVVPKDLRNCIQIFSEMKGLQGKIWEQYVGHATQDVKGKHHVARLSSVSRGEAEALDQPMEKRITDEIPFKVSADKAYQNARQHSDRQNARIEHDKALQRVITALFTDDTQLFKQFQDNESFRRWLTDTVFGLTYKD